MINNKKIAQPSTLGIFNVKLTLVIFLAAIFDQLKLNFML